MVTYGNPSGLVGLTIELRTVGPVPVIVGQGILGLVGESTRGPVATCIGMGSWVDATHYFHSGDLKEAIELAFGQGAPVVYAVRVLGTGYATATRTLTDGLTPANNVVVVNAASEGNWGNSVWMTIADSSYYAYETETNLAGDGTVGPYYTQMANLVHPTPDTNWVKVNGVAKVVVYSGGDLAAGKVHIDIVNGSITFYTGEEPTTTDVITYSIKHKTKHVTLTDNVVEETYDRIRSLDHLEAELLNSALVRAVPEVGETHLPTNGTFILTGGSDGLAITVQDWEDALAVLGEETIKLVGAPTCVAITSNEVNSSTNDLIPALDAFLTSMANDFHPCLGFVGLDPNTSQDAALEIASGYNNRLLSIVPNPWDDSDDAKNIAVARAAKECAMALGESAAMAANAMNGLNGLLNQFTQTQTDVLTYGGLDVIIKKRGILPYIGISTVKLDSEWQFARCVDNRTINYIIVATEYITRAFYHKKRTKSVLSSIKSSIQTMLEDLKKDENIRAYTLEVLPHATDTGRVNIYMSVENIGHIERFRTILSVGILEGVE